MAYKNIVWIKLERRLINDYRWYQMSIHAQLYYVKFILLAAETYNKIPKNIPTLSSLLRNELEVGQLKGVIKEIQKNFPKFKSNRYFYYFDEFENKTNWLPTEQSLSKRPAIAEHSEEKKRKEKEKKREEEATPAHDIYNYYAKTIKPGAKVDAIKNIDKLLKIGITKEDLIGRINAYKKQLTAKPTDFIIQANNFFGEKARYKDFEPVKIIEYLPADKNCKACQGAGKLQTGEGVIIRCACVKEKK